MCVCLSVSQCVCRINTSVFLPHMFVSMHNFQTFIIISDINLLHQSHLLIKIVMSYCILSNKTYVVITFSSVLSG